MLVSCELEICNRVKSTRSGMMTLCRKHPLVEVDKIGFTRQHNSIMLPIYRITDQDKLLIKNLILNQE